MIEGDPGIGKTRVLAAARCQARERGFTILTARAGELESAFAFGVVRQLFEAPLAALSPAARAEW